VPKQRRKASSLEHFQDRLLLLLEERKSAAEIRAMLLTDKTLKEFHDYIKAMDDHMLEVAVELTGKWSTKGKPS
jgi:hypothetical protein